MWVPVSSRAERSQHRYLFVPSRLLPRTWFPRFPDLLYLLGWNRARKPVCRKLRSALLLPGTSHLPSGPRVLAPLPVGRRGVVRPAPAPRSQLGTAGPHPQAGLAGPGSTAEEVGFAVSEPGCWLWSWLWCMGPSKPLLSLPPFSQLSRGGNNFYSLSLNIL